MQPMQSAVAAHLAGWRWATNCYRLVLYAALLLPGFMQVGWHRVCRT
jgi:hypothetical protein